MKSLTNILIENKKPNVSDINLSDAVLKEIALWGLKGYYNSSGSWDYAEEQGFKIGSPEGFEIAANVMVESFKQQLNTPFPNGLKGIGNNPRIYRMVTLKNPDELNTNDLGESWFANERIIKDGSHDGQSDFFDKLNHITNSNEEKIYILVADILLSGIDIVETLWRRDTAYNENEIVVKDQSKLKLIDVKLRQEF